MNEIWKPIKGYIGIYEVSNVGRVKVLDRFCGTRGNGKALRKGRILKPILTTKSYHKVLLWKDGKSKNALIHQLVAKAFISNPNDRFMVNHINEIKTDNRVENLEWTTYTENNNHGTRNKRASMTSRNNKLSKKIRQKLKCGLFVAEYPSIKECERVTGFNCANLSKACDNGYYRYGYYWEKF